MVAPRKKAVALAAPQTLEEAQDQLARYATLGGRVETIKAHYDEAIIRLEAERDGLVKPLETEMASLFTGLRIWWSVAGTELTQGKRKSTKLAGCLIGERTPTPSLKWPKGIKVDGIISALKALPTASFNSYVVTSFKLAKPALIKSIRAGTDGADFMLLTSGIGLSISQVDEFFIARAAARPADPETMPDHLEGERQ